MEALLKMPHRRSPEGLGYVGRVIQTGATRKNLVPGHFHELTSGGEGTNELKGQWSLRSGDRAVPRGRPVERGVWQKKRPRKDQRACHCQRRQWAGRVSLLGSGVTQIDRWQHLRGGRS